MSLTQEQLDYLRSCNLQIAIPCYGGQLYECVLISMMQFTEAAVHLGMSYRLDTLTNESLITRGRCNMVAKMMSDPTTTHLLFIDSDIGFSYEHIFRLLLHDKDVVGGLYPKKSIPIDYVVNIDPSIVNEAGQIQTINGLIPVTRLGTGFMMIKRSVFEKMFAAYPETKYVGNVGLSPSLNDYMYSIFDTSIDPNTKELRSEDWHFCDLWRALGGEIWADPAIKLDHTGHFRYLGDPEKLAKMLGTPQMGNLSRVGGAPAFENKPLGNQ